VAAVDFLRFFVPRESINRSVFVANYQNVHVVEGVYAPKRRRIVAARSLEASTGLEKWPAEGRLEKGDVDEAHMPFPFAPFRQRSYLTRGATGEFGSLKARAKTLWLL